MSSHPIIENIIEMFTAHGDDWYMGEPVTMAEHMLQSAHFAVNAKADDELIIAALLHDIGHYTSKYDENCLQLGIDNKHEDSAAVFLAPYFPKRVVDPIRLHVTAKRYLCSTSSEYYDILSEASKESLEVQGGKMDAKAIAKFESEPNYRDAILVRYWDDAGKKENLSVMPVEHYIPMMKRLILN